MSLYYFIINFLAICFKSIIHNRIAQDTESLGLTLINVLKARHHAYIYFQESYFGDQ